MANIEVGLFETERQLSSMIEASGKTVPQPGERANIVDHLDYIIQLLGTMVSTETYEAAKEKMANGYNAINDRIEIVNWLLASGEISGDVDMEPLTVTENGEYMPGAGKAFGRVVVDCPESGGSDYQILFNVGSSVSAYNPSINTNPMFPVSLEVNGFSTIGAGTPFAAMFNLEKITMNDIFEIPSGCFSSCRSIKEVYFPKCETIGSFAFSECRNLTSILFPKCAKIYKRAFMSCSSLTSVNFPAISNHFSEKIETTYVFYDCTSLITAEFPNATYTGSQMFYGCTSLKNISFPKCEHILYGTFDGCTSLTELTFPECIDIEANGLQNIPNLTSISLPKCRVIGDGAFVNCSSLSEINLPSCNTIGNEAFKTCTSLSTIYLNQSEFVSIKNMNAFVSTPLLSGIGSIYAPESFISQYIDDANWSFYKDLFVPYN